MNRCLCVTMPHPACLVDHETESERVQEAIDAMPYAELRSQCDTFMGLRDRGRVSGKFSEWFRERVACAG